MVINSFVYAIDESFYVLDSDIPNVIVYDPAEKVNRTILDINLFLLDWVGKPVNTGYTTLTNYGVRNSVSNFFKNFSMPFATINYLLQGDINNASKSLHSFLINSVFGVVGLFDVADDNVRVTHLSITLGKYGVPAGPYIMLPLLGPNNLRGVVSDVVEFIFDPFGFNATNLGYNIFAKKQMNYIGYGITTTNGVKQINFVIDGYYDMIQSSFDNYIFIRDAYKQLEDNQINK
ncbi:MAG: VacJ family lipoprotein [Rickettsiales bacterium]|nr:VacJ family lipoprotein [Rickettsiales bacterium]